MVDDLVGERVADVQLERGTAQLWFQGGDGDPVQVRWFTGGQEPCESFTVTVGGGSEDANRHAAVDLAERVRLPSELDTSGDLASADLEGTGWWLERSTVGGVPTDGNGVTFSFENGEAAWTDGCNSFGARFTQPSATELELGDISSTEMAVPHQPHQPGRHGGDVVWRDRGGPRVRRGLADPLRRRHDLGAPPHPARSPRPPRPSSTTTAERGDRRPRPERCFGTARGPAGSVVGLMGSLIKKRRKRMRKKKHKKMLKRTRWQRRAAGK